jgi:hypothetical protein
VVLGLGIAAAVGLRICCLLPAARVRGTCCSFVPCCASSTLHFARISPSRVAFMLRVLALLPRLSCMHFHALALCRVCELPIVSCRACALLRLCFAFASRLRCAFARCTCSFAFARCAPARRARSDAFSPVAFASCASGSGIACCARALRGAPAFNMLPQLVVRAGCELPPSKFTPPLGKTASRRLDLTWWSSFFFAKKRRSRCVLRLDKRGVWSGPVTENREGNGEGGRGQKCRNENRVLRRRDVFRCDVKFERRAE